MKILKFLTLIVFVQVGSKLWINPKQIIGIEDNTQTLGEGTKYVPTQCGAIIIFAGGGGGSPYAYECSDWEFNKVKAIIEKEHN